ncbi:MAG TPA: DeoR/GlpR family DNA-binding transcription regulator [bacterium]|jgi:DeoR/GlpR family transcriptional regulator of sugar metabolism|nr:DeoR/GlpR transcriptional regulator [Dictyoglomota bacterium]HOL54886.1 DeoR/GlpR family DNA-binding transcription regulator [bacterium]HOP56122.1 DeoR/GlpR family DNA-binding transcription regulator [bacterium]HPC77235.1 DeoR/GlpR family DNA-binding transcription regulator [bacterium]HPO81840.1 DeoR/GlpR family DNA-binding transcription regulator [bacterium]
MRETSSRERRDKILEILIENDQVRVSSLCKLFNVSRETIRHDLIRLQEEGLIIKEHGSAALNRESILDIDFAKRARDHAVQKRRIGLEAAKLIKDGETIIIDSGSTTPHIARNIRNIKSLTVITPSLKVTSELGGKEGITVIMPGGIFNPTGYSLYGPQTEEFFPKINANKLFLAIHGVDIERGLTEINIQIAHLKQVMINSAKEIILVADSSKFGRIEYAGVAPIDKVNAIITDRDLDKGIAEEIQSLGINLILV